MITRFRLEAEDINDETVEEQLESATQSMLGHLRDFQPSDTWECTDEQIVPALSWEGDHAVIYGRRVFRRMGTEYLAHPIGDNHG